MRLKTRPSAICKTHLDLNLPGPIITFGKMGHVWNSSWWKEMWCSGKGKLITFCWAESGLFHFLVLPRPSWNSFLLVCSMQLTQAKEMGFQEGANKVPVLIKIGQNDILKITHNGHFLVFKNKGAITLQWRHYKGTSFVTLTCPEVL